MKIKVRTKEQQAIDNLKAIVNSKGKKIEIEPPVEDTAQILLDYINNLQECCKDKTNTYQVMIIEYSKLLEKYKKSCETYQEALDETMSEKMNLEDKIKKAIDYVDKHTIEWKDDKFEVHNIMVKFNEYSNPQALKDILNGDKQ